MKQLKNTIIKAVAAAAAVLAAIWIIAVCVFAVLFRQTVRRPADGWPHPVPGGSREAYRTELLESEAWLAAQQLQNVTITSFDGLTLSAQVLSPVRNVSSSASGTPSDIPAGVCICVHGIHSAPDFEFAGIYQFLHELGHTVILVDQRTHGRSGGTYITFGEKERYDLQSWAEYAAAAFPNTPIWLFGVSMGCASVLMASGLPLPANVKGFIGDCGYTTPYEIVRVCAIRDYHMPADIVLPAAKLLISSMTGFDLESCSVPEALKINKKPVLFVHGTNDAYVPYEMSRTNYESCTAPKFFLETSGAHAANFLAEPEAYKRALKDFFDFCLRQN